MPVVLTRASPATALDIEEAQILLGYPNDCIHYFHRQLLTQIADSRWFADIYEENMDGEDVIPLARADAFPRAGFRPIFAFSVPTAAELADWRFRALSLGRILGAPVPIVASVAGAQYLY